MAYRPGSGFSKMFRHIVELCSRKPMAERVDMSGRRVIVTGATPGSIGYQVARTLAVWGADIAITRRRDSAAARETLLRDLRDAGHSPNGIEDHRLDLADARSVADFADWYRELSGGSLDVLINNAGILRDVLWRWRERRVSPDGFEIHWRTNYLGTFHLTRLFLPMLLESGRRNGDARVINVSSLQHDKGNNAGLFQHPDQCDSWTAYGLSKLALIHHSFELQRRYRADSNLRSAAVHPGTACSNMALGWQDEPWWLRRTRRLAAPLAPLVLLTPAQAAQTTIRCATDPQLEGGHYHERCARAEPVTDAHDEETARRLWEESDRWFRSLDRHRT